MVLRFVLVPDPGEYLWGRYTMKRPSMRLGLRLRFPVSLSSDLRPPFSFSSSIWSLRFAFVGALALERGPKRRKLADSRTHSSLSFNLLTWFLKTYFSDLVCSPCLEVGVSLWCYPSLWLRSPLSCSIQIRFWGRSQLSHPPGKRVPRVRRLPLSDRGALISCNIKESSGRSRSLTQVRDATKTRNWKHISGIGGSCFFFLLFDPKFSSLFV